jgi:hypothetical protein
VAPGRWTLPSSPSSSTCASTWRPPPPATPPDLSSREDLQDIRHAAALSDTGQEKGFHLAVARASRNPYRLQMIGYLYEAVQDAVRAASRSPQEEARFQAHCRGEHELVVRAIESHDAPAASAAMRRHLLSVADLLGLPLPGRELVAAQEGATKKRTRQFDRRRSRLDLRRAAALRASRARPAATPCRAGPSPRARGRAGR